jgi:hypothetical protein
MRRLNPLATTSPDASAVVDARSFVDGGRAAEIGHATSNTKSKTTSLRGSSVEMTRSSEITDATDASSRDARQLRSIEQRVERVLRFAQPPRKRLCEPAMQDDGYRGVVGL